MLNIPVSTISGKMILTLLSSQKLIRFQTQDNNILNRQHIVRIVQYLKEYVNVFVFLSQICAEGSSKDIYTFSLNSYDFKHGNIQCTMASRGNVL